MNNTLSERQITILKLIVEQYISNAQPISSKEINDKFLKDLSSATIRNDMVVLEKMNLIEKTHTSSGRIPSTDGYTYYQKNILEPTISVDLKNKLRKVFAKRLISIENIIDESISIVNETLKLPSILTTKEIDECLKRIDLIPLSKSLAIILLVSSSGNIVKNTISFKDSKIMQDLSTCISIFNERLIDTPLSQVPEKIKSIQPLIQSSVENYEFVLQEIINKIFVVKENLHTSVRGTKYLTSQPEFANDSKKMKDVLDLLENSTVWEQISYQQSLNNGKTILIAPGAEFKTKDLMVASTTINGVSNNHQISVVGPTRMNYAKVKGILDFIKSELEKKYNE